MQAFPILLHILQQMLASSSTSNQVAEFIKLVFKIFWSTTYMEIPSVLLENGMFVGWMQGIHTFITRPIPPDVAVRDLPQSHTIPCSRDWGNFCLGPFRPSNLSESPLCNLSPKSPHRPWVTPRPRRGGRPRSGRCTLPTASSAAMVSPSTARTEMTRPSVQSSWSVFGLLEISSPHYYDVTKIRWMLPLLPVSDPPPPLTSQ